MEENRGQTRNRETFTIATGAGVVFVGTLLRSVLRYLFQIVIARRLGAQSFGVFSLGFTIFRWMEYTVIVKEILAPLSRLLLLLLLFFLGRELYGAVATYTLLAILATGLGYRLLKRTFLLILGRAPRPICEWKEILSFSSPRFSGQVPSFADLWRDTLS